MKLLQCSRTRLRNRCKRGDVGRIAARVSSERSEVAMLGLENMPYRICEETLGQVVPLFKTYTTRLTQCFGGPDCLIPAGRERAALPPPTSISARR
jgi:hypothetical protein